MLLKMIGGKALLPYFDKFKNLLSESHGRFFLSAVLNGLTQVVHATEKEILADSQQIVGHVD